ncbi:MAG: tyrosine-type recombinase/integrase [Methylotenera sp.]|nr:tyrosine-type recombinase/integrase [Methylotenera sp.]
MAKLTVLELQALTQADTGKSLSEDGGIRGEVRSNQSRMVVAFSYRYRFNAKTREIRLGVWPNSSLPEIRKARAKARSLLDTGKDPLLEKQLNTHREHTKQLTEQAENAKQQARMTVHKLFEKWETLDLSIRRKDKGKDIRRIFEKDVLPAIGAMSVEDVRKGNIAAILDTLLARGVPRLAKMTLTLMRQMFRFAQDRDIIDNDPTSSIRKAQIGGKDVVRDRHLSEVEIKKLKAQIPDARLLKTTECAIWIILSTCCRIGELCKAKWEHLDLEAGTWKIPTENSKNGKPHTIQLSDFAKQQFNTLVTLKKSDVWIYPNTDNTAHVCEKSITKQVGDRQLPADRERMSGRSKHGEALILTGGKWTPHDLRRTGATTMGNLGIRPDVIELCLNHIEQNEMKRTYQHQKLIAERVQAWKLLGERLSLLTSENTDNVVVGNFAAVA